jgi:hypothetical protein
METTKEYVAVEIGNQFVRKGESFLGKADIDRCVDKSLANLIEAPSRCFGFLDASTSIDKTSLVIVAEEDVITEPWDRLYVPHIKFWEPSEMLGGVIDEKEVQAHVESILSLYSGLIDLWVDVRGQPWAMRLQKALKHRKVKAWTKNTAHESDAGWDELERRIRTETIRLPDNPAMRKEFAGVKRKASNPTKVVDIKRHKSHKDITEGLALCCYLIAAEAAKVRTSLAQMRNVSSRLAAMRSQHRRPITKGLGPNSY